MLAIVASESGFVNNPEIIDIKPQLIDLYQYIRSFGSTIGERSEIGPAQPRKAHLMRQSPTGAATEMPVAVLASSTRFPLSASDGNAPRSAGGALFRVLTTD